MGSHWRTINGGHATPHEHISFDLRAIALFTVPEPHDLVERKLEWKLKLPEASALRKKFEDRTRLTLAEARARLELLSGRDCHIVSNDDGSYSVVSHLDRVICDFCVEEARGITEHAPKRDIHKRSKSLSASELPN